MPVKRKARNKSSTDSTRSPDDKKKQEKIVVVFLPKMTTKFLKLSIWPGPQEEDQTHLSLKLGKLDITESRLQDMFSTLANIEQTVSRLDEEVKILKVKTNGMD